MLSVENLTKIFKKGSREVTVLDNVTFFVREGEIVGLLGPNGSGKTTLINLLLGIYLPDSGDVKIYGESIYKNPGLIKKYVRIPYLVSNPRFTVYEILKLTSMFWNVKNYEEKINYWLEYFGLEKEKDVQYQKLSTGNQVKLEIIGAMLSDPKILLLDEITNGLDVITVEKVLSLLKSLSKDFGVSILFASHIFDHVEKLCNRVIILYNGRILADDDVSTLKKVAGVKEYLTIKTREEIPENFLSTMKEKFEIVQTESNVYKILSDDASASLKELSRILSENPILKEVIESIDIKKVDLEDVFAYFVSLENQ